MKLTLVNNSRIKKEMVSEIRKYLDLNEKENKNIPKFMIQLRTA